MGGCLVWVSRSLRQRRLVATAPMWLLFLSWHLSISRAVVDVTVKREKRLKPTENVAEIEKKRMDASSVGPVTGEACRNYKHLSHGPVFFHSLSPIIFFFLQSRPLSSLALSFCYFYSHLFSHMITDHVLHKYVCNHCMYRCIERYQPLVVYVTARQ